MATTTKPQQIQTPDAPIVGHSDKEQNAAAPKRTRKKGVKYTKIVESEYKQVNGKEPENPLDRVIQTGRGGLQFPGLIFETHLLGSLVKIPAKAVAIKAPTLRQLMRIIDEQYKS
jgi:hypothetical protein